MRQSLSKETDTLQQAKPRQPRLAVPAMGVGLLLTVVMMIALIIDQASFNSIADHVDAQYAPLHLHPDPNVLFGFLYVTGLAGAILWLTMIWGVRGHKRWARVLASIVFVVGAGFALFVLFVSEYGNRIFPTPWGLFGLLPSIAGLVTVIQIWTPDSRQALQ